MKTILKLPIYVEIETDNVDRARVTSAANQILYKCLLEYLSGAQYTRSNLKEFREAAGVDNVSVKLLTELDLFKEKK